MLQRVCREGRRAPQPVEEASLKEGFEPSGKRSRVASASQFYVYGAIGVQPALFALPRQPPGTAGDDS